MDSSSAITNGFRALNVGNESANAEGFDFLALPKELRMMVYEHHLVPLPIFTNSLPVKNDVIVLGRPPKSLVQLQGVNKLVASEALEAISGREFWWPQTRVSFCLLGTSDIGELFEGRMRICTSLLPAVRHLNLGMVDGGPWEAIQAGHFQTFARQMPNLVSITLGFEPPEEHVWGYSYDLKKAFLNPDRSWHPKLLILRGCVLEGKDGEAEIAAVRRRVEGTGYVTEDDSVVWIKDEPFPFRSSPSRRYFEIPAYPEGRVDRALAQRLETSFVGPCCQFPSLQDGTPIERWNRDLERWNHWK